MKANRCIACIAGVVLASLLAATIVAVGQQTPSCTIFVRPGESIQAAIDRAPDGAVICLTEGTWQENITITTKNITLQGAGLGKTIIRAGDEQNPVVRISGDQGVEVQVEKMTIRGGADGVFLIGSAQATINDCGILANGTGVWVGESCCAIVSGNIIAGNEGAGIYCFGTGAEVQGKGNVMRDNGIDLYGNLAASLRQPLVPPTEQEIVYPDERYSSLQAAVDALLPGGRLVLKSGEYAGGLTIGKEVEIVPQEGKGVTLRAVSASVPVIYLIGEAKLTVRGIKLVGGYEGLGIRADAQAIIQNCQILGNDSTGIELRDSACATISGCEILSNSPGLELAETAQAVIQDCQILDNGGAGIWLWGKAQAVIQRCQISESFGSGIDLGGSPKVTVEDCHITENHTYGVRFDGSMLLHSSLVIARCQIASNADGISLGGSCEATIRDSDISDHKFDGIVLKDNCLATITGCKISSNGYTGINITDWSAAIISGNVIEANNKYGICYTSAGRLEGEGNIVHNNQIKDIEGYVPARLCRPFLPPTQQEIVYPDERYSFLQAAVGALVPGGKLILKGGEYAGGLTIDKEVEIVAQEGEEVTLRLPSSDLQAGALLTLVRGAKLTARGLKLVGGFEGLVITADAQATITECEISEDWRGITLTGWAQATIQNCSILDNGDCAVGLKDQARAILQETEISRSSDSTKGSGIMLVGFSYVEIVDCHISMREDGLLLGDYATSSIQDCQILANTCGIDLEGSAQATIHGCEIAENVSGIAVMNSAQATIERCEISENAGGIMLFDSARANVVGNKIIWNISGVSLNQRPCADTNSVFSGYISGKRNLIPGPSESNGNFLEAVCPDELDFLMTDQGGELDRRK